MHDLKLIRDDPAGFDRALARRAVPPCAAEILRLDLDRRGAQTDLQRLQSERNEASRLIGRAKAQGQDAADAMARVAAIKVQTAELEATERDLAETLDRLLAALPNLPAADIPDGADETANLEVRRWGEPPRIAEPRQHFELGEALGQMDFGRAAKLAGARFTVLTGGLARLERALGQFMLDIHTREWGYTEVAVPLLVNDASAFGTGQLPKFSEDLFRTTDGRWLISTAEMPLTNLVADEIIDEARLPLRFTALTPCFRSEAGAAGRDTRGMIRQHQFNKVELVSIAHPDAAEAEHERLTGAAESVLRHLNLPYRVMKLSAGDMGFSAAKTYDLEVWLPGQGCYREISSCSWFGDFQARRMKARFRPAGEKNTRFVHTLNGSGLAVGRTLVAVMENYQRPDGSITVPEVLLPYMGGIESVGLTMFGALIDLAASRILVSNDDGVGAPGIRLLERAARDFSRNVWVVAPETEQSGAGHSLTLRRPLRIRKVATRHFAVDGTPTDCVLLSIREILKKTRPDLVLSGVNHGGNMGEDVTYSGTVAAAMEGTLMEVPAVAFSLAVNAGEKPHWASARHWVPEVMRRLAAVGWARNTLINVNLPNLPADQVRGIRATRQGRRKIGENIVTSIDPRGRPYYWIGPTRDEDVARDGTDIHAVANGWIAVTPIHLDLTDRLTLDRLGQVFG